MWRENKGFTVLPALDLWCKNQVALWLMNYLSRHGSLLWPIKTQAESKLFSRFIFPCYKDEKGVCIERFFWLRERSQRSWLFVMWFVCDSGKSRVLDVLQELALRNICKRPKGERKKSWGWIMFLKSEKLRQQYVVVVGNLGANQEMIH